jgi:hypothetical protein
MAWSISNLPGGLSLPGILLLRAPNHSQHCHWCAPVNARLSASLNPKGTKGVVMMQRSIEDYRSLLVNAISSLGTGNAGRQEIYERARAALKAEFDKLDPPPSEFELLDERLKLDFAIHALEWSTAR